MSSNCATIARTGCCGGGCVPVKRCVGLYGAGSAAGAALGTCTGTSGIVSGSTGPGCGRGCSELVPNLVVEECELAECPL
eukprot:2306442-Amphidinium_carterae.1